MKKYMPQYRKFSFIFTLLSTFICLCAMNVSAEPVVIHISGKAEIQKNAESAWTALNVNTPVPAGASVRIQGKGTITLKDSDAKTTIKVRSSTQVGYEGTTPASEKSSRPEAKEPVPHYSLPQGNVDIIVEPGNNLDLLTPLLLTSVRGTGYSASVTNDGSSSIEVTDGIVMITDKLGQKIQLTKGQRYTLTTQQYIKAIQNMPREGHSEGNGNGSGGGGGGGAGGGGGDGGDD